MKQMIQKMREEKDGFTIAELLVVVAIIAVLVAIAIPVFTATLDKAQAGTDEANIRGGYGAAQAMLIDSSAASKTYYLANDGSLVDSADAANVYTCKGDSTKLDGGKANIAGDTTVTWSVGDKVSYERMADSNKVQTKIVKAPTQS